MTFRLARWPPVIGRRRERSASPHVSSPRRSRHGTASSPQNLYIAAAAHERRPTTQSITQSILPTSSTEFSQTNSTTQHRSKSTREIIKTSSKSMGVSMKRARDEKPVVSLALSLNTESSTSTTTSANSASAPAATARKRTRRGRAVATSGEGEFVCKTCGRAFETFQALGGHRTSHLRGRHGLELGVGVARAIKERQRCDDKNQHDCHICGLGFETGQALGGHMRRHREEIAPSGAIDRWVALLPDHVVAGHQAAADRPPVLLELFV